MPNLDSYTSVKVGLFVRLQIDEYRTTSGGAYTNQVLKFSDYDSVQTINTEAYTPLGEFLSITASTSELRPSENPVTIAISGIPTDNINEIIHSKIKGSPIKIYRGYYTVAGTQIGDFTGRFIGSVNNYSIQEEFDIESRTSSHMLMLECASSVGLLTQKIAGRKTNPQSQKTFFSADTSMDRVPTLKGTKFNFGAPQ
ncbi:hypothetical protein OAP44_02980 [Candidatus Pelagibacter sp.]|nr:hypothetical protein [Candidatus Pelagibacter sp.]